VYNRKNLVFDDLQSCIVSRFLDNSSLIRGFFYVLNDLDACHTCNALHLTQALLSVPNDPSDSSAFKVHIFIAVHTLSDATILRTPKRLMATQHQFQNVF
jgi:hypothetical protein